MTGEVIDLAAYRARVGGRTTRGSLSERVNTDYVRATEFLHDELTEGQVGLIESNGLVRAILHLLYLGYKKSLIPLSESVKSSYNYDCNVFALTAAVVRARKSGFVEETETRRGVVYRVAERFQRGKPIGDELYEFVEVNVRLKVS